MSEKFWAKLSSFFGLLAIGLVFGLLAVSANIEVKDLDLWLHIKTGKVILETGMIPDHDIFSCTVAGRPWVNHEWLFQVIVYIIHSLAGFDGLITMQVLLVIFTLLILLVLGYSKDRQLAIIFVLIQVLLVYQSRFTIRPDLYSLLFFVLYMYILSLHIDKRWSVFALFFIQVLWTNMHGFFFFGPIFITIAIVAEGLKRYVKLPYEWNQTGRLTDEEYARLQIIWIFALFACFINPLWVDGAIYPIKILSGIGTESKVFFQSIMELQKPITQANIFEIGENVNFKILIIISFFSFIFNRRKIDISALFIWLVFLLFSLSAMRNMVFFAFAAYLAYMVNIISIRSEDVIPLQFISSKFKNITGLMFKIAVIFWMLDYGLSMTDRGYFDFDVYERKAEFGGVSKRNYPYHAADFLVQNKIKGNFFNDFNSGAYLIGRTYPAIRVFIDGRTELYGSEYFSEVYLKIWKEGNEKLFDAMAQKYNITGAFLNSARQDLSPKMLKMFYNKRDWKLVYFDYDACIFLKDVPQYKDIIARFAVDLTHWQPPKLDLLRVGSKRITPLKNINRSHTLMSLELYDAAFKEGQEIMKIAPDELEAYRLMGRIYDQRKEYEKAFENIRVASTFAPFDVYIRFDLAAAYEHLGDYKGASKQYEKIISFDSGNPKGFYGLARTYAHDGQDQNAVDALKHAISFDAKALDDILKVGDIFYEKKKYHLARQVCEMAFGAKTQEVQVHNKLGLIFTKLGDFLKAKEQFEKGIGLITQNVEMNEELQRNLKSLQGKIPVTTNAQ